MSTSEKVTLTQNPEFKTNLDEGFSHFSVARLIWHLGGQDMSGYNATEVSMNLARTLRAGDVIEVSRDEAGNIIRIALVKRAKRG